MVAFESRGPGFKSPLGYLDNLEKGTCSLSFNLSGVCSELGWRSQTPNWIDNVVDSTRWRDIIKIYLLLKNTSHFLSAVLFDLPFPLY